jgi:tRNA A-37 threonylcarbamoyl transferase component Bud32
MIPKQSAGAAPKLCPHCQGRYPADFRVCPRDATPLEDAPAEDDPLVGATLGDSYAVVRVIGEGGMGRVYEARHRRLATKRYAIKVLHHEMARQPDFVARFQREAEAASALSHPNVVTVHDVNCTADGRPYIVCELLQGLELGELLDRVGKLSVATAVFIVRQVCEALAAAHERGIVHRDLKPENLFLTGDLATPVIKVLDFGISKVAQEGVNLTRTGTVMGTPGYMAPEQARGDKVDARADVYATGAILYRALTGRAPFEGLDPMATLTAVLAEEPPRPRALEPAIPETLELALQRAMAKQPAERTPSMADLHAALAPFDTGEISLAAGAPVTIVSGQASYDPQARTLLASREQTAALAEAARGAKLARPTIAALTFVGVALAMGLLIDAAGAAIRQTGEGRDLTSVEVALTGVGVFVALATPGVLWVRWLARRVWASTPRSVQVARRLRRTLLGAAAGYGAAALGVHVFEAVVRRQAAAIASPLWTLVMFAVAVAVAASAWFLSGDGHDKS